MNKQNLRSFLNRTAKGFLISFSLLSLSVTAFAAVQYPDGGVWTYGAGDGGAFSNYYHGSKDHSSTVVSRANSHSDKGYAGPGETSYAWIKTYFGEPVSFFYDHE